MKRSVAIVLLLIVVAGCDGIELRLDDESADVRRSPAAPIEYPTVNLPVALRQATGGVIGATGRASTPR